MYKILIVGYGIVGKNLESELMPLKPDIFDKYNTKNNTKNNDIIYDIAFICVDTPFIDDKMPCDLTEIENALIENNAKIYVLKSTVIPGSSELLSQKTGKTVLFSPEYYGSTHFSNNYKYDFTIIGGPLEANHKVIQILQNVYDGRHHFITSSAKAAELVKYMENCFLAMKVSFCVQFWLIAKQINVDYETLRELFIVDPRINPSNTFVFDDHPFWDSHCFNKDLAALVSTYDAPLIKAVIEFNNEIKNKFNFLDNCEI